LKPLFDNYIKKYGKKPVLVPVEVANWQQKFEKLQIALHSEDQKYEILLEKYNQSIQESQAIKAQLESGTKANTSQNKSIDNINRVSSELLKNYEKLQGIDGDIVLEFQDGKTLKAHRAVLIG
jgi:hypothetical protein